MRRERAESVTGEIVSEIDRLIRQGVLPARVMSVGEVLDLVDLPILVELGGHDRDHVVRRVDEVLRLRAGAMD